MKILFITRYYPPFNHGGGIASYVAIIAPVLASRGHEVHVLSCAGGQKRQDHCQDGVHVHRRGVLKNRTFNRLCRRLEWSMLPERLMHGLSTFREYRRLGIDFDVVEYPDWFAEGWMFALVRPLPLVAHLHASLVVQPRFAGQEMSRDVRAAIALERFAARRAHRITAPSRRVVEVLGEMHWLGRESVDIIPFPLDGHRWLGIDGPRDTAPIVLFLGRVERIKAPEVLVEAMSIVRRKVPGARALFVGASNGTRDGLPYVEWLKGRPYMDPGACEFVDRVPRDALPEVFARARVLAIPSHFESFSMVVTEAMAAGRPVVVTASAGVAELLEEAAVGRVVPPGDPEALARALLPFLENAAYAAEEGGRARAAVCELLDADRIASLRERVYAGAIASFHGRSYSPERAEGRRTGGGGCEAAGPNA